MDFEVQDTNGNGIGFSWMDLVNQNITLLITQFPWIILSESILETFLEKVKILFTLMDNFIQFKVWSTFLMKMQSKKPTLHSLQPTPKCRQISPFWKEALTIKILELSKLICLNLKETGLDGFVDLTVKSMNFILWQELLKDSTPYFDCLFYINANSYHKNLNFK